MKNLVLECICKAFFSFKNYKSKCTFPSHSFSLSHEFHKLVTYRYVNRWLIN